MRIDKWLWAARFFKTRSLSGKACDMGRVESNGQTAKPAREVRVGDILRIRNSSDAFVVEVLVLSEMRGPGAIAQTLYRETDESREARAKEGEERRIAIGFETPPESRPSKRDRRRIERFRGR